MFKEFFNVWLLALVSALAFSVLPLLSLIGSLLGAQLAPAPQWATLPIAMMVIGTAAGVWPAARCMGWLGRKPTFFLFINIALFSCWLAGQALTARSFSLLCFCSFLFGMANAAFQQIRFAAMETVPLVKGPTAASIIMCSGIIAAIVGPELAVIGRHTLATEYQGSFWMAGGLMIAAMIILTAYKPAPRHAPREHAQPRPVREMLNNPRLLMALASATVAFVVMTFVMTGTPISMHLHHGHRLEDTKWVIQSHIVAMFLPSLATPWLFKMFSVRGLMMAGLACYAITITIGLIDSSVLGFWGQLVMLGIGWNFLFVSGTALLPSAYEPGEQYRAQALNDGVVFSAQAMASLSAGWAVNAISWHSVLLLCVVPMAVMAGLLIWNRS